MTSRTTPGGYVGTELPAFALASNWKRYIAELLQPYVRADVLEIGAGIGATSRALVNANVLRWVAVEPDPRLAAVLAGDTIDAAKRVTPEVIIGTIEAVPAASRFDTILYIDVLEHIEDDRAELGRASAKLRENGHLIVLSPAFPSAFSGFDRAVGHYRRYTVKSLASAMPAGLERRLLVYADSVGLFLSFANRFVLRRSSPSAGQVLFWDRVIVPMSRVVDRLVGRAWGKSVIAVYRAQSTH